MSTGSFLLSEKEDPLLHSWIVSFECPGKEAVGTNLCW